MCACISVSSFLLSLSLYLPLSATASMTQSPWTFSAAPMDFPINCSRHNSSSNDSGFVATASKKGGGNIAQMDHSLIDPGQTTAVPTLSNMLVS